jgi:hypothetical protein
MLQGLYQSFGQFQNNIHRRDAKSAKELFFSFASESRLRIKLRRAKGRQMKIRNHFVE